MTTTTDTLKRYAVIDTDGTITHYQATEPAGAAAQHGNTYERIDWAPTADDIRGRLSTHHGPAVCVKDHGAYNSDPARQFPDLSEEAVQMIYDGVQADWWEVYAQQVAEDHGYGQAYSAGRSAGWVIVDNPGSFLEYTTDRQTWEIPAADDTADDYTREEYADAIAQRDRFLRFAGAILQELDYMREVYAERLAETMAELETRREAAIVRGYN